MPRGRKRKQDPEILEAETTCVDMANPFGDRVCEFGKGDQVYVINGPEDAPDNFYGQVIFVKWSNISGWWLDVQREDNSKRYSVPEDYAKLISFDDKEMAVVNSGQGGEDDTDIPAV